MASFDYDVGILGGGAAGLTMAAGAAQLGAKTVLIERAPDLGGDCLHFGCVPSKTLIASARVYHQMRQAERYGLPALEVPPVDFARVAARIREVIATIQAHDSLERFCGLGVRVEFGQARFVDEHCVDLEGRRIAARYWLIATGSRPAPAPVPGLAETPHITNQEIFSLERLPESLLVLGAGPIAIEMAQAFARLGSRVTVVQRSGQILSNDDPDLAGLLLETLRAEGVEVILNAQTLAARDLGHSRELTIRDEHGERRLSAQHLLVALGRAPNLEDLGLEAAGVEYNAKGLQLDNRLRTSQRHIFGAGDVTGAFQFTHAAGYEAGVALTNAVLRLPRKADYTLMPWCTYSDPELASIGLNEKQAKAAQVEYQVWSEDFAANDRALAEGSALGRIKLLLDHRERPLGVQILGPRAGELLNEWVAALGGGLKLSTLAGAVHPYPTLGEINKRLAGSVLAPKLFSERVRKGLRFFFSLKGRACPGPPAP
ncbi:MAG: FAD-dependent oxidoreductase [Desulfarculus sp.]|nr:FAD-dependent oxidoreductase [Desulfarculus sp.]